MQLMRWILLLLAASSPLAASDRLLGAIEREDAAETARLLKAGEDPNAANRYGITPLSVACVTGNPAILRQLIAARADVNASLPDGETPLMTCARTGKVEAIQLLLAAGAKVNPQEAQRRQNALMWAAAEGHAEAVKVLLAAGATVDTRLDTGFTALLFAAREGHIDVCRALIAAGADVNDKITPTPTARRARGGAPPRPGTSALMMAVISGHFELGKVLVELGANPNAIDPGVTALHLVTNVRKPGVGDNNPPPDGSGKMTSLEFVRFLIAKGADVNARMTKNVGLGMTSLKTINATPYFLAAKTADAELMRLLHSLGADPSIRNADNSTALMAAAGLGTRSPGEDAGTEPEVLEAVQVALEHGADINAVDDRGETAMHAAAYKNLPAVVEYLFAHGAKPEIWNQKNKQGWTPLRIAEGYRFGNFKPSPVTIAAFHRVMKAAGIAPLSQP